jgi:hypothetical protein
LLPALSAIWIPPWVVTQDGPAHLYNAHILARSWDPASPFRPYYRVSWDLLPNWLGHLAAMGALSILPPRWAEKAMMSLTLVGFAASILWLRWEVRGRSGLAWAIPLAVLLALNVTWLFGFTSFLLGSCLYAITLGVWWRNRDCLGLGTAAVLAVLLILGYLAHVISLALAVVGLLILLGVTSGPRRLRAARWRWTSLSMLPLVPLGLLYRNLTHQGGVWVPKWEHLANPLSPRSWLSQLSWVDPLSLAGKTTWPTGGKSIWFVGLAPVVWIVAGLGFELLASLRAASKHDDSASIPPRDRGAWILLAAVFLLGGLVAPDSFGDKHGYYLPQRVVLLGLVAFVPVLELRPVGDFGRAGAVALGVAWLLQSCLVWSYAVQSNERVGAFMRVAGNVGRGQRIATLLNHIATPFRANPVLHADSLLGIGTGNILWSNYETRFYYFPVQFRAELNRPAAKEFEDIGLEDRPAEEPARRARWERLLERYHAVIDELVVWDSDPGLDLIHQRRFTPVFQAGKVQLFRRRASRSVLIAGRSPNVRASYPASARTGASRPRSP